MMNILPVEQEVLDRHVSDFVRGYVLAALWTAIGECGSSLEESPVDYRTIKWDPESLDRLIDIAEQFEKKNAGDLDRASRLPKPDGYLGRRELARTLWATQAHYGLSYLDFADPDREGSGGDCTKPRGRIGWG